MQAPAALCWLFGWRSFLKKKNPLFAFRITVTCGCPTLTNVLACPPPLTQREWPSSDWPIGRWRRPREQSTPVVYTFSVHEMLSSVTSAAASLSAVHTTPTPLLNCCFLAHRSPTVRPIINLPVWSTTGDLRRCRTATAEATAAVLLTVALLMFTVVHRAAIVGTDVVGCCCCCSVHCWCSWCQAGEHLGNVTWSLVTSRVTWSVARIEFNSRKNVLMTGRTSPPPALAAATALLVIHDLIQTVLSSAHQACHFEAAASSSPLTPLPFGRVLICEFDVRLLSSHPLQLLRCR